jgi:hypothetical protein
VRKALIFVVFYLLSSRPAIAQVQNGQITGVVTDQSGATVAHAGVHVSNLATGYEADFESNDAGIYTAPELLVGSYRIRVEMTGFKTAAPRSAADFKPLRTILPSEHRWCDCDAGRDLKEVCHAHWCRTSGHRPDELSRIIGRMPAGFPVRPSHPGRIQPRWRIWGHHNQSE